MIGQNFVWDGEKIRIKTDEDKVTPKDILNGLAHGKNQVSQMEDQKVQTEQQLKQLVGNIDNAKAHVKKLEALEEKCTDLQKKKLVKLVSGIKSECEKEARVSAMKIISKDPDAFTADEKRRTHYVEYQKLLATNEKVSNKISKQIITQCLYVDPVFDNPFKNMYKEE